jgi:hypothetical protein
MACDFRRIHQLFMTFGMAGMIPLYSASSFHNTNDQHEIIFVVTTGEFKSWIRLEIFLANVLFPVWVSPIITGGVIILSPFRLGSVIPSYASDNIITSILALPTYGCSAFIID